MWVQFYAPTDDRHKDHAKYIPQYSEYFPIYGNPDIAGVKPLQPKRKYHIGNFIIMPLEVPHGECPNFAYVIEHPLTGRICFVTDAERFPYTIKDCRHLIIECNYSEEIVLRNMLDGKDIRSSYDTHLELEDCIEAVKRLQNPFLRSVTLCHLSKHNADAEAFIKRFAEEDISVEIARKGKVIDMNREDF